MITPLISKIKNRFYADSYAGSVRYRLANGAFWSLLGSIVSRGLMLGSTIFIARILGKATYGEFGIIRSTIEMFGVFAGFGLSLTATKHISEYKTEQPDRAGKIIALLNTFAILTGALMSIALFIFAPLIAEKAINAPYLAGLIRISSISLFLSALNGAQLGALSGFEAFKVIAKVNLWVGLSSFTIQVIFTLLGGLSGAVWGMVLRLAINWALNKFAIARETSRLGIKVSLRNSFSEFRVLWTFILPAAFSGFLVSPVNWVCNSIIVNKTDGFSSLGIYSAALSIMLIVGALNNVIGQAMLPLCVTQFNKKNRKFDFININLPWIIGLTLTMPFVFIPEITVLLFGDDFNSRSMFNTVIFVMFATLIISHRQGIARNFAAGSYMWWSLVSNGFWGVVAIICTYFFSNHGAEGRSAALAIAYLLNTLMFIPFYIKKNLCSSNMLFSKESIFIWIVVFISYYINLKLSINVFIRAGLLIAVMFLFCFLFLNFWRKYLNFKVA